MKNINFSPQAKVVSPRCRRKKRIALLACLAMTMLLIILFWYEVMDSQRECGMPGISGQEEVHGNQCDESVHADQRDESVHVDQRDESVSTGELGKKVDDSVVGPEGLRREENRPVMEEGIITEGGSQGEEEKQVEGYYLKVCSGVIKRDVDKVMDSLARMGFSPHVVQEQGLAVMYNVYIDPNTIQDVGKMLERLKKNGFFVYRQKNQKDQHLFRVASCYYPKSAAFILENLKSKGFFGNIVQEKTKVKLYSILLGQYSDLEMALERQKQLMLNGFSAPEVVAVPLAAESVVPDQPAPRG